MSHTLDEGSEVLYEAKDCSLFTHTFSHNDYDLSRRGNTTFYVYVYNFETPFWLVVSRTVCR